MRSESGRPPARCSWTLLLGPGPLLDHARPYLELAVEGVAGDPPQAVERLESWAELHCAFPNRGKIVLDGASIAERDRGLVEVFLDRHPGWELWTVGGDPTSATARALAARSGARWLPSPLDLESLRSLAATPAEQETASPERQATPLTGAPSEEASAPAAPEEAPIEPPEVLERRDPAPLGTEPAVSEPDALLAQKVQAILRGESSAPAPEAKAFGPATSPSTDLEFREPAGELEPVAPADGEEPPTETRAPHPPAPYFRNQVADLADLVQCVDHSLEEAATGLHGDEDSIAQGLESLRKDLGRLSQFTRTLSFLAAPPGPGQQRFDLGPMLTEMLAAKRAEPDAPRYLIRSPEPLDVRSDRMLLTQGLDALLFLCHWCAGPAGTVRVDGRRVAVPSAEDPLREVVRVSIRFPAGELADLEPAELLEPYGLRRRLPELGPNALAAASGILRGQGGSLELLAEPGGGLEWRLELPQAD